MRNKSQCARLTLQLPALTSWLPRRACRTSSEHQQERQPCVHSLVALPALSWTFFNHWKAGLFYVGFLWWAFLWQCCALACCCWQTFKSTGLYNKAHWPKVRAGDMGAMPVVCRMSIISCHILMQKLFSCCKCETCHSPPSREVIFSPVRWDQRSRQPPSSPRAKGDSATSLWEQLSTCHYLTYCQQYLLHCEGKKRNRKIY